MLKKLTSILLVVMLLATLTPSVIFAAEQTAEVPYTFVTYVRGGGHKNTSYTPSSVTYAKSPVSDIDNRYYTFISVDFSDLESKVRCADSAEFYIMAGGQYSSQKAYSFDVVLLSDACEEYVKSGLTYQIASDNGLLTGGSVIASNTETLSNGTEFTGRDFSSALMAAIDENPQNSVVTFRIEATDSTANICEFKPATPKIILKYNEENINDTVYLEERLNYLTWADISDIPSDAITENLTLPSKLYGADVTWESDNDAILSDGTVTQPRGEAANVTLTAKLNYNGAEAIKKFELIVPELSTSSKTVNISQKAHIQGTLDKQGISYGEIVCRPGSIGTYDHRVIFYQFDLTGKEAYIDKASKAIFSMNAQQGGGTFKVTLLSDSSDNWDEDTLSYQIAYDFGMVTDVGYTFATGASALNGVTYTSSDFLQALKAAIAENPANSLITLRIESESGQIVFKNPTPTITMEYYDEDVDTDAFFEEKKDTLSWENITTQPINNVVADLDLPSQFYGFDVTWSSSVNAIINSTGEVTVGNEKTEVKLTATITDGTNTHTKEFNVTVSDEKYAIEFSNNEGTAAKIYAAQEAADAVLVFASYIGNELISIDPVAVNIAKGETPVNSVISTSGANKIKIMLLSDMDKLTPLCTYKEK